MARMYTAALILISVVLLFHFGGLLGDSNSPTGYILNNLGILNPQNLGTSQFWITLGLITTLGIVGVTIGTIISRSFEAGLFYGAGIYLVGILLSMGWDLILIFNQLQQISNMLAVMIVGPLIFAWGLTLYDWARGRD